MRWLMLAVLALTLVPGFGTDPETIPVTVEEPLALQQIPTRSSSPTKHNPPSYRQQSGSIVCDPSYVAGVVIGYFGAMEVMFLVLHRTPLPCLKQPFLSACPNVAPPIIIALDISAAVIAGLVMYLNPTGVNGLDRHSFWGTPVTVLIATLTGVITGHLDRIDLNRKIELAASSQAAGAAP